MATGDEYAQAQRAVVAMLALYHEALLNGGWTSETRDVGTDIVASVDPDRLWKALLAMFHKAVVRLADREGLEFDDLLESIGVELAEE